MALQGSSWAVNVMWCHNKQLCAKTPGLTLTTERQLGKCGESILVKPELPGSTAFNAAIQESLGEENLNVYKAEDVSQTPFCNSGLQ